MEKTQIACSVFLLITGCLQSALPCTENGADYRLSVAVSVPPSESGERGFTAVAELSILRNVCGKQFDSPLLNYTVTVSLLEDGTTTSDCLPKGLHAQEGSEYTCDQLQLDQVYHLVFLAQGLSEPLKQTLYTTDIQQVTVRPATTSAEITCHFIKTGASCRGCHILLQWNSDGDARSAEYKIPRDSGRSQATVEGLLPNHFYTIMAYDIETDGRASTVGVPLDGGNFSTSQIPAETHNHDFKVAVPATAAAVILAMCLLAIVGVVAIITYKKTRYGVSAKALISQRRLHQQKKGDKPEEYDQEHPPPVPPQTPDMHCLMNTTGSSSSASTRSTTVSSPFTPRIRDVEDSDNTTENGLVFAFPVSSATDLDAISCESIPPPIPPRTQAATSATDLDAISCESIPPPIPPRTKAATLLVHETQGGGVSEMRVYLETTGVQGEGEDDDSDTELVSFNLVPPRNIPRSRVSPQGSYDYTRDGHPESVIPMKNNPAYTAHHLAPNGIQLLSATDHM